MTDPAIVIIGAGVGGLASAIALQRAGFAPRIFEQAPAFGEVGAGLSLSPNATKGLEHLGLAAFLERVADEPVTQFTHHGITGEDLVVIDRRTCRDDYGAAYFQLHRADFHAELARRVLAHDRGAVRLGATVTGVEEDETGATVIFEDGATVRADIVIGADGVRSVVRDRLFGDDAPTFTGHMAWRALAPASDLPAWFAERASHVWIGAGRNCVSYPVRRGTLVNFVAFARAEDWVEESWSARAAPGEIARTFQGWCPPVAELTGAINASDCFRWGLFARAPLARLATRRVALVGDAGHPMLPYFGQGASSAIEDAVVLGRCFGAAESPDEALQRYDGARRERVTRLQAESNLGGDRLHALDPYTLKNQPLRNEDALGIFRYDPVTAPV
ncbi:MAG: FAD-dependent monooxygenase [Caulobacterales bacterium]|nr:FAD-dependent monooxygenase [Caulobacterales bacterium]